MGGCSDDSLLRGLNPGANCLVINGVGSSVEHTQWVNTSDSSMTSYDVINDVGRRRGTHIQWVNTGDS